MTGSPPSVTDAERFAAARAFLAAMSRLGGISTEGVVAGWLNSDSGRAMLAALEAAAAVRVAPPDTLVDEVEQRFGPGSIANWDGRSEKAIVGKPRPGSRTDLDRMSEAIRSLSGEPVMGRAIGDGR